MNLDSVATTPVRAAIAQAARQTGMDFEFLLSTATRESSLNPNAQASTSSASGLFQFTESTWLTTLARYGARHGLGPQASMINIDDNGNPQVNDADTRRALLQLRFDPNISALMAGEFANENADYLRRSTGKEPTMGDLYAAHFLGAGGAAQLINAASENPFQIAANMFPAAAGANRPVFYDSNGRPKSVAEVIEGLRATALRAPPPPSAVEFTGNSQFAGGLGGDNGFQRWRSNAADPAMAALIAQQEAANAMNRATLALLGDNSGGNNVASLNGTSPNANGITNPALIAQMQHMQNQNVQSAMASYLLDPSRGRSLAQVLSPDDSAQSNRESPTDNNNGNGADALLGNLGQSGSTGLQSQGELPFLRPRQ